MGTWDAATFVIDGTDLIAGGTQANFVFTRDTYSLAATGDTSGVLCETGPDCSVNGDISSTATTITFDPGDVDAVTLNWAVTGDVLTITGTIEGSSLAATLNRL